MRQTRADSVAVMIDQFFEDFPNPSTLAKAGPELELLIRPLGFATQRGRQLRALADAVDCSSCAAHTTDWAALPGIGRYSAGMVSAVLGQAGAVAVDTNIARLIQRLYGVEPSHSEARKSVNIWRLTSGLTRADESPAAVLWALLDLASAVCQSRKPKCPACPLIADCNYARLHRSHNRAATRTRLS